MFAFISVEIRLVVHRAMLHYLLTACGLSAEVLDNNQRTPLHLLCEHGHPEAFEYLVRKQVKTASQTSQLLEFKAQLKTQVESIAA